MGLVESLLLSAVLFLAGAIVEHDSKGEVTHIIKYADENSTRCTGDKNGI